MRREKGPEQVQEHMFPSVSGARVKRAPWCVMALRVLHAPTMVAAAERLRMTKGYLKICGRGGQTGWGWSGVTGERLSRMSLAEGAFER